MCHGTPGSKIKSKKKGLATEALALTCCSPTVIFCRPSCLTEAKDWKLAQILNDSPKLAALVQVNIEKVRIFYHPARSQPQNSKG